MSFFMNQGIYVLSTVFYTFILESACLISGYLCLYYKPFNQQDILLEWAVSCH